MLKLFEMGKRSANQPNVEPISFTSVPARFGGPTLKRTHIDQPCLDAERILGVRVEYQTGHGMRWKPKRCGVVCAQALQPAQGHAVDLYVCNF
jgi:hypothetical protein